jgi:hypothetical protein
MPGIFLSPLTAINLDSPPPSNRKFVKICMGEKATTFEAQRLWVERNIAL